MYHDRYEILWQPRKDYMSFSLYSYTIISDVMVEAEEDLD